jgi:hypothetical protein
MSSWIFNRVKSIILITLKLKLAQIWPAGAPAVFQGFLTCPHHNLGYNTTLIYFMFGNLFLSSALKNLKPLVLVTFFPSFPHLNSVCINNT